MNNTKLVKKNIFHLNPLTGSGFWELAEKILQQKEINPLSNFDTINIIKNLSAPILSKNTVLSVLTEDFNFSKELFKIFSNFKCHKISPDYLKEMLQIINIFEEDKKRFSLIIDCFQEYENFLTQNNYDDSTNLIQKAIKALENTHTDFIAEIIFQNFLTPLQKDFLQKLENTGSAINYIDSPQPKLQNKEFYKFDTIKTEAEFIRQDILQKIAQDPTFSDFGLIIRNSEQKQIFINEFKKAQIPIYSNVFNEKIHNFKLKINFFIDFFEILKKLKIPYFSFVPHKNSLRSFAEYEGAMQETDNYMEEILEELLPQAQKDKLLEKKETTNKFLYEVLFEKKENPEQKYPPDFIAEIDFIKNLYSIFLEDNFEKIIAKLSTKIQQNNESSDDKAFKTFLDNLIAKLKTTQNISQKNFQKKIDTIVLKELIQGTNADKTSANAVYIGNLQTSKHTKYLYLPCFSEDNYPKKPKAIYFISPLANELISNHLNLSCKIIDTQDILQKKDELLLNYILFQKEKNCVLSYHSYQKKQLAPSIYLSNLLKKANKEFQQPDTNQPHNKTYKHLITKDKNFLKEEKLYLSPSAIANFLSCKRKYFYANLLEIKTQSTFKASYGSIVHAILQVFGKSPIKNKQILINLTNILFNSNQNQELSLATGFEKWQIALILETDNLSLTEMKSDFLEVIENLELTGWFDDLPQKIETEVSFYFELPEIENVIFDGKIDAIYEWEDKTKIIDYKTGTTKKPLEYYFSDDGVNFTVKSGSKKGQFDEKNVKKYDYQIPIYYLASQNAENLNKFKENLTQIGLNYIRTSKNDGINYDFIEKYQAENYKNAIIKNLKNTVVEEIRKTEKFDTSPDTFKCKNCPYKFLCDEDLDD